MIELLLLAALVGIVVGAELFTNGLEHIGARWQLSQGVTGSIFAAVATALPEATVPVVSMLSQGSVTVRQQVATGAILGAPLMLSTLALFLTAAAAVVSRGFGAQLQPERSGLVRDLRWFLTGFSLSTLATFVPEHARLLRGLIACTLIGCYLLYVRATLQASRGLVAAGQGTEAQKPLYSTSVGLGTRTLAMTVQLLVGFALVIGGTQAFIRGIEHFAHRWPPLVLSLLVIPIATELPEKVNSILWIRRGGHDTLAFGNITGALVFQGTLLPALGVWLTPWTVRPDVLFSMGLTLIAVAYLWVLARRGPLRPYHLVVNGLCYVAYLVAMSHA